MVANGQLLGSPSDGKLVTRKIDPRVLRRPAFWSAVRAAGRRGAGPHRPWRADEKI